MSGIEFTSMGEGTVIKTTKQAALIAFRNGRGRMWIPFSVMSTPTRTSAKVTTQRGGVPDVRVESWWYDQREDTNRRRANRNRRR